MLNGQEHDAMMNIPGVDDLLFDNGHRSLSKLYHVCAGRKRNCIKDRKEAADMPLGQDVGKCFRAADEVCLCRHCSICIVVQLLFTHSANTEYVSYICTA